MSESTNTYREVGIIDRLTQMRLEYEARKAGPTSGKNIEQVAIVPSSADGEGLALADTVAVSLTGAEGLIERSEGMALSDTVTATGKTTFSFDDSTGSGGVNNTRAWVGMDSFTDSTGDYV